MFLTAAVVGKEAIAAIEIFVDCYFDYHDVY